MVVDYKGLGGGVVVRCAPGAPKTGLAALAAAVFDVEQVRNVPGFVCRINGRPGADRERCVNTPPASAYWSYWHARRGGSWVVSQTGPANRTPPVGSVEGWSFAEGSGPNDAPPPGIAPPSLAAKPTPKPTPKPTRKPTPPPTARPTARPTAKPARAPTARPTAPPTAKTTAEATAPPPPPTPSPVAPVATAAPLPAASVGAPAPDPTGPGSPDPTAPAAADGGPPAGTIAGIGLLAVVAVGGWALTRRRQEG